MLNIIWPVFIILSYGFAFFYGSIENVNNSIFEYTKFSVDLLITLIGTMCLWNGIMEIAFNTNIVNILKKVLSPFINFLFPDLKTNETLKSKISMNIIANMLGLGNASTPIGLKVIENMHKKNKDNTILSDDMATFIILNTASIQIIPTTVISIRMSLGSTSPTEIIFPVWISTICAASVGILLAKLCQKKRS